jgi:MOSC domain-containing protein YiiM
MHSISVRHLFISPGHNFFRHHGHPPGTNPIIEKADVECVAGKGLRGDRFFEYQEDYKGQITFFSIEVLQEVCEALSISTPSAGVVRRNVIVEGIDLNQLIGKTFEVQGVLFEGVCECKPCYWMDQAIAPGAEVTLQGRGGLRAKILTDGRLRVDVGRVMPQHSQSSLVLQSYQDRANGARSVICLSQAIS